MTSSRRYAAPLCLEPRPSRWLRGYLYTLHILSALVAATVPIALIWRGCLIGLLGFSLWRVRRVHIQQCGDAAIRRALWDENDAWWLTNGVGAVQAARLCADSLVTLPVVILLFKGAWRGTRALVLLPDSLDSDTLRRLRVRLRMLKGELLDSGV